MSNHKENVIWAARSVADASLLGRSMILSETLRQLRAAIWAMDHDDPPAQIESILGVADLRAVPLVRRRCSVR